MKWPFKRKPMAADMAKAVFELLTDEEIQALYDPDTRLLEKDIRDVIKGLTPNKRARHSMKKSLKIASEEFVQIKKMPLRDGRTRVLRMFGERLFKF